MVRFVRTRRLRDAVSLLPVHVGRCHFIYLFLFGLLFCIDQYKKLDTGQTAVKWFVYLSV